MVQHSVKCAAFKDLPRELHESVKHDKIGLHHWWHTATQWEILSSINCIIVQNVLDELQIVFSMSS